MKSIIDQVVVSADDRFKKLTPVMFRRHKLIKVILEQIQETEEYLKGRQYMRRFMRSETDSEANKRITIMSERPARRWLWIEDEASLLIQVRYLCNTRTAGGLRHTHIGATDGHIGVDAGKALQQIVIDDGCGAVGLM